MFSHIFKGGFLTPFGSHPPNFSVDIPMIPLYYATSFLLVKAQYSNAFGDDIVDPPGHVDHVAAIRV